MIIKSILNNSALIAISEEKEEIVLVGKGISFQKHPGDEVDTSRIEKIFKMNTEEINHLVELLKTIPEKYFETTTVIVRYANKKLGSNLDNNVYITLFDHINSAIERFKENIHLDFGMLNEVEMLYPEIYSISEWAVDYINAAYNIDLSEDECGFISIHLINALSDEEKIANAKQIMRIVKSISELVNNNYKYLYETQGIHYLRFLTHLKYLAVRYLNHNQINDNDPIVFTVPKDLSNKVDKCVEDINNLMVEKYNGNLSEYEKSYLVLHLCRLLKK